MAPPDIELVRSRFPALDRDLVFLENAGGSQVPGAVADAMREYMLRTWVQLGAGYPLSDFCTDLVARAHDFVGLLLGGTDSDVAILGPSSTQLVMNLAAAYAPTIRRGDEIVVMESAHEANVGPWVRLAGRGATIRTWRFDPERMDCPLDALDELITDRTRLVALVHVSNLLGGILDVRAAADRAHAVGARVVVDGVAFAPHRAVDVAALGADYYVYSVYKVYGPHLGAMVASRDALAEITGPNHYFIPREDLPGKFEPGGVCHEGCAGILALADHLRFLAGRHEGAPVDRAVVEDAFAAMAALERPLQERLVPWLADRPRVRLIGPATSGPERVPTVSFVHGTLSSSEVAARVQAEGFAIRHGHMYAHRLMEPLGLRPEDGVVRVSAVHYNSPAEIEALIRVLDRVLT